MCILVSQSGGTRKYKGRLDTATTPPAEASGGYLFEMLFVGVYHLIEILAPQKVPLCAPTHENQKKKQKKNNRRKPYLNSRASHFEVIRGQIGHIEAGSLESMCIG